YHTTCEPRAVHFHRRKCSAFSPAQILSTTSFGTSGIPAAISLRARLTRRAVPTSSSASRALAASASNSLRGRLATSPLLVILNRTFMTSTFSVIHFSAVADRNHGDRSG